MIHIVKKTHISNLSYLEYYIYKWYFAMVITSRNWPFSAPSTALSMSVNTNFIPRWKDSRELKTSAVFQIIRYCRGGEGPLWVSGENKPEEKDIPNCVCGAKRIFEFQIMPQLLNHLHVDSLGESIDWGTLVVYTCADNCGGGNKYLEEFIWKQDYSMGCTLWNWVIQLEYLIWFTVPLHCANR